MYPEQTSRSQVCFNFKHEDEDIMTGGKGLIIIITWSGIVFLIGFIKLNMVSKFSNIGFCLAAGPGLSICSSLKSDIMPPTLRPSERSN